jgi:hypothetical protein
MIGVNVSKLSHSKKAYQISNEAEEKVSFKTAIRCSHMKKYSSNKVHCRVTKAV